MTCKEEHFTRESHAPILRLQLRLTIIAYDYVRNRNAERRRRINRLNAAIQARNELTLKIRQTRQKVRAWMSEVDLVHAQAKNMLKQFRQDAASVTPQDWDAMFKGQERKLLVIFGEKEVERWPAGVPSLNFVALAVYRAEQREVFEKKAREKKEAREKKACANARVEKSQSQKRRQAFTRPTNDDEEHEHDVMATRERYAADDGKQKDAPVNFNGFSALEDEFASIEFEIKQAKKQHEYLRRSQIAPWTVSYEQWCEACRGTDALEEHPYVRKFREIARRREDVEKVDDDVDDDDDDDDVSEGD